MRPKILSYICYSCVIVAQALSSIGGSILVLISADHNNIVIGFVDINEWNRRSQIMDLLITKNVLVDCNANWISSQLIGRRLCSKVPFQLFSLREKNFERAELAAFQSVQSFALSEKYQSINQPLLAFHRKRNSLTKEARFREDIKREASFSFWPCPSLSSIQSWRLKKEDQVARIRVKRGGGKKTQLELVECDRNWRIGRCFAQSSSHILSLKAGVLSQEPLPSMKWS